MSRKKIATYILDVLLLVCGGVCLAFTYTRIESREVRILITIALVAVLAALAVVELVSYNRIQKQIAGDAAEPQSTVASALVLLGEGQRGINRWDLTGYTSVIIGKDGPGHEADINLLDTEYSSMIDDQHAILNFTENGWYVEDLASRNGTAILRPGNEREQYLTPGMPCKLEPGNVLCIASDTRLAVK